MNEATKVVFSRTRTDVPWRNSRLFHALDPREIEALKRQPGSDIMVFGSGSLVSQLTEHGLVDEYQFVVTPFLLGSGRSLLSDVSKSSRLDLLEAKQYQSGNVMLRYAPQLAPRTTRITPIVPCDHLVRVECSSRYGMTVVASAGSLKMVEFRDRGMILGAA